MRLIKKLMLSFGLLGVANCQTPSVGQDLQAKSEIADLVNAWGFYRDQNNWSALGDVFTPDGQISVSWICGPHKTFVAISEKLSQGNTDALKHLIGPPLVRTNGDRAVSEANVTISVRTMTPFGEVDSTTSGRFLDRLIKQDGAWKIQERVAIYEKDRLDPLDLQPLPASFYETAKQFPKEIKFLAMALKSKDVPISPQTVLDKTDNLKKVYLKADVWLENGASTDDFWIECAAP